MNFQELVSVLTDQCRHKIYCRRAGVQIQIPFKYWDAYEKRAKATLWWKIEELLLALLDYLDALAGRPKRLEKVA